MKFTISWLGKYVSLDDLNPTKLAERLTMLGLEVDAVEELHTGLQSIIVARITKVRPHPNADRLVLCDVDAGSGPVQVVCGAPNTRDGLLTAFARPGSVLPNGLKVKEATVRGERSFGMLCSEKELGISEDHSGIMELDPSLPIGSELTEALELRDTMVEIDLTPNRPDCASIIGIAREVAALTGNSLNVPEPEISLSSQDPTGFSVIIEEPYLCPRYGACKIKNVTIKPSPWWLKRRLLSVGLRPINNIVDITNLVMLEYGQPLHAFDFEKLSGRQIVVRQPDKQEKSFTTLDNNERPLDKKMLMICDAEKPVAIAGIMGGLNSEVTSSTKEILLESACFNPVSIRRTARKLNLSSEASYRFERGVDPDGVIKAMKRAASLIVELAGATIDGGIVDEYPGKKQSVELDLRVQRVCDLIGTKLSPGQIGDYLQSIGFDVKMDNDSVLRVRVPSFRVDIEREIDLIEEVARFVGYNDIPVSMPDIKMDYPERDVLRKLKKDITSHLISMGITEAINYSFSNPAHLDMCNIGAEDKRRNCVNLLNPLSEEQSIMRSMLLPGMLENVKHNLNFQRTSIRLFEIGKIFFKDKKELLPIERLQLCVVLCGERYSDAKPLYFSGLEVDFFEIKGVTESLLEFLGNNRVDENIKFSVPNKEIIPLTYYDEHACLIIKNNDYELGRFGRVDRNVTKRFGIKQDVFFLEMEIEPLCQLTKGFKKFKPLPRYPAVKRDVALLVSEDVAAGEVLQAVFDQKINELEHADIFDVYGGKSIEKGMKSIALSITYRSSEQTLEDETVDSFHEIIVDSLMTKFGGRYREGQD